jgi:hypothetical protein
MGVPRPDIGVWELENVLALGQFLVSGHRTLRVGYGLMSSLPIRVIKAFLLYRKRDPDR